MPDMFVSNTRRRRRRWPFVVAALVLLAGLGVAGYFVIYKKQDNTNNPNAEFKDDEPGFTAKKVKPETFKWPIYGFTPQRTRFLNADIAPPFKKPEWRVKAKGLIEFQPVLANGFLYFVDNTGTAFAVNAKTGKKRWRRRIGSLNAASPAWSKKRIFVVTLKPGSVMSLDARTGKVLWKKDLPSRAESSPIVIKDRVYFGSEDGTVYALQANTGKKVWTYKAGGAVKAGLAYSKGLLIFGAYGGTVYALRASNGKRVWSTATSGREFGRSGNFYATPAIAYGRVYVGNTDGFVYSFVARTGQLAWRHGTSNYVYSAAAVGNAAGTGPTVYVGSYDGKFYALDARDGSERWSYSEGGKLSGAPTVVGKVVYFSNFGSHTTTALDVRRGKRVWRHKNGAFNPVISDGRRVYLTTYSSVAAFVPRKQPKN
jgi:outer membrane protein assembly factor BamB